MRLQLHTLPDLSLYGGNFGYILNSVMCLLLPNKAFRDQYREIATAGDGMNWHLVERFIEVGVAEGEQFCC